MQYQAYPSDSRLGLRFVKSLRTTQNLVHGNESSVVIPCALLIFICCVILHHQLTALHHEEVHGKFLFLVLGQMIPLAIADMKILRCKSPLKLFSVFSEKVFIMTNCFLTLRIVTNFCLGNPVGFKNWFFLAASLPVLFFTYGVRPKSLIKHVDVAMLLAAVFGATLLSEAAEGSLSDLWRAASGAMSSRRRRMVLESFLYIELSNMIEIAAFVPAIWSMLRAGKSAPETVSEPEPEGVRLRAVCFFGWLLTFYLFEDLVNAWEVRKFAFRCSLAHLGHYLLLLDFAAFILGHFCDTEKFTKLRGAFTGWLVDACSV